MSAGLAYLQKLRKSDLTELAETSNLKDYAPMRKSELEVALDHHLRANQTRYLDVPSLSHYYKRLGPASPTKKFGAAVKSEAPEKKFGRRKSRITEETGSASDQEQSLTKQVTSMIKTPGRNSLSIPSSVRLPPSPAAVTDAIDRQTTRIRKRVSGLYSETGIHETSESLRHLLSSPVAINIIALILEANGLRQKILQSGIIGFLPNLPYITNGKTPVYLPNLFLLLDMPFWAPFSLWVTTSLLLPLLCAYFINIPLKTSSKHHYGTRRATSNQITSTNQFDPLVYNIAKALVAYIVYAHHSSILGLFAVETIEIVTNNVLGGYQGMITGATAAGIMALYEAILKRQ